MDNLLHDEIDTIEEMRDEAETVVDKVRSRLVEIAAGAESFEEVLQQVNVLVGAELADITTRAVGSAMLLLVIAIYAWGITMHSFMKDDAEVFMYWGTVTRCMMTLMANGTLGDST